MTTPKILIVDDDENIRTVLRDILSSDPYSLIEAADGQRALELAAKERPDLILLDIMMPGMDGDLVLRKLKDRETTRDIPVIMVTALNLDTQISACLDDGAVDHIGKPFSSMIVRSRVRAALRSRALAAGEKPPAARQGKIFAFVGAKGGVGTTMVAVNVALSLLKTKKSVVLAEIRVHAGTLAIQLGASPALNIEPLLQQENAADINPQSLSRVLTPHTSGLQLLLAPPDVSEQRDITEQQAEQIITGLTGMFDYVLVDIPADPAKVAKAVLRRCHFVSLVVELETTSLAAAMPLLKALDSWGIGGSLLGVVLVHHLQDTLSMTVSHARRQLACPLTGVIPPAPDLCAQALHAASPLVLSYPESLCAAAFDELADRLVGENVPVMAF